MGESTRRNIETARIRIETEAIRFVRGWSERDGEEGGRLIRNRRAGSIRIRYSIRVNVTYAPKSLPPPPRFGPCWPASGVNWRVLKSRSLDPDARWQIAVIYAPVSLSPSAWAERRKERKVRAKPTASVNQNLLASPNVANVYFFVSLFHSSWPRHTGRLYSKYLSRTFECSSKHSHWLLLLLLLLSR